MVVRILPSEDPLDAAARVLADADSEIAEETIWERDAEVADRLTVDWSSTTLIGRLAQAGRASVHIELVTGDQLEASVIAAAAPWVRLALTHGAECVINCEKIVAVRGLSRTPVPAPKNPAILRPTGLLREFLSGREVVIVSPSGRTMLTHVDHVGRDHLVGRLTSSTVAPSTKAGTRTLDFEHIDVPWSAIALIRFPHYVEV